MSGSTAWDSGAISTQTIAAGDGYVEFKAGNITSALMAGLGNGDSSYDYLDIEYAFWLSFGSLQIYENGAPRATVGSYNTSDVLKVAVENGAVKYYRNGTLLYTSSVAPQYPLQVDTSLDTVGAQLTNVVLANGIQNVSRTNLQGTASASGSTLQKSSGSGAWDSGAVSSQAIASGDGYVEFQAGNITTASMIGLANGDSSASYLDIEFAIFLNFGTIQIYESGALRGTSYGSYGSSDVFRVASENGIIKYYKNGSLLYTSSVTPTYPLKVDTSMHSVGAQINSVVISAGPTAGAVNYVMQDVQGSSRAVMTGTSVVARHDYLPFGEELGSGVGSRTGTQGYGATDGNRRNYGTLERDDVTGLDHTWWRKYENLSGRWTTPDPYRGRMTTTNPQSFNAYAYAQNDSVNFIDPSGLIRQWCPVYPIGDGAYRSFCYEFPDPLFPQEPNPRVGPGSNPPRSPVNSDECRAQALKELGDELKAREEIFSSETSKLLAALLLGYRLAKTGGALGTMIEPGAGSVTGTVVGFGVGVTVSAFISDMREAKVEQGPVKRFMQKDKHCNKMAKQEAAEARTKGNAMSSAPSQMFVVTRQFGTFALYPYTIESRTLLGDFLYTTYGRNPSDPITTKFGR